LPICQRSFYFSLKKRNFFKESRLYMILIFCIFISLIVSDPRA
jgi:hypothetical protein